MHSRLIENLIVRFDCGSGLAHDTHRRFSLRSLLAESGCNHGYTNHVGHIRIDFHVVVVCAALLALGRRGAPRLVGWAAFFAVYYTAVHAAAVASSRYRLPLMPLVIAVASLWLARPSLPEGRTRRLSLAAALAGFLVLASHYVATRLP